MYPTEQKRNEVLAVFQNRNEVPLPSRKMVKVTLLTDFHIKAALLDTCTTLKDENYHIGAFQRQPRRYLEGDG